MGNEWPKKWDDIQPVNIHEPTPANTDTLQIGDCLREYDGTLYINEAAGYEDSTSEFWMPLGVYFNRNPNPFIPKGERDALRQKLDDNE